MLYNIIKTGSQGNCIIYCDSIAVDLGITYKDIIKFTKQLQIVLLTHIHKDHFNIATIKKLAFERPSLRFATGSHLLEHLKDIKNVDVCEIGKIYDYGSFKISPIQLYHDVTNFGWRIFKNNIKIFHATDTSHLEGIQAQNYDLYAIEGNYNEETIFESIEQKKEKGEFCYKIGAINSHLSEQQANEFFYKNKKENSELLLLHKSTSL